jgi:hypothetical protein
MVAADLTKWVAFGNINIQTISGYNAQGATVYIQLFQIPPLAAGGITASTVPAFKSLVCPTVAAFNFNFQASGLALSECLIGLSSTEANYTAVAASSGLDLTMQFDSDYICIGGETVVGDLTTNQQTLQVWTEANGATARKRLLRVDLNNNDAANAGVLQVYAVDSIVAASLVVSQTSFAKNTTGIAVNYGVEGLTPLQQDANKTQHFGCNLNITGSTNSNVRAIYR